MSLCLMKLPCCWKLCFAVSNSIWLLLLVLTRAKCSQTAYMVAIKSGNVECAAVLNLRVEEPLSWPTPWEHILPAQGSQARQWLEEALAAALSPDCCCRSSCSFCFTEEQGREGSEGGRRSRG